MLSQVNNQPPAGGVLATDVAVAERRKRPEAPEILPAQQSRHLPFPLTDLQQAYLTGRSGNFELGNVSTHLYLEFESSSLDIGRLSLAWQLMIERHGMLRAIIHPEGQQEILEDLPPYRIEVLDLRGKPKEEMDAELAAVRGRMSHQVLPSNRWPLFEFFACRLDGGKHRLHVSLDMLILDARSQALLFYEWSQLYQNPSVELPSQELTFQDYVAAEAELRKSELFQRDLEYWRERLLSLPPGFDLPLAKDPSAVTTGEFKSRTGRLDARQWESLKAAAERKGLGRSAVLLAAYAEVLRVWSKTPRFTINVTLVSRLARDPRLKHVIGDYTSSLLLGVDAPEESSFEGRALKLQQQLRADLEHSSVSGVQAIRERIRMRPGESAPAMPVVFTSMVSMPSPAGNPEPSPWLGEADWLGERVYTISQTPQVWLDCQSREQSGALFFNWDAVEELFPAGLLDDMFDAYCRLLRRLAEEDGAWQESRFTLETNLLPAKHRESVEAVNATAAPLSDGLLQTFFVEQARKRPDDLAVITPHRSLSYGELTSRANQVGHWLRERGASPNTLVAVVMEKGWEQIVAVLGVLASGAAYLPIDARLPKERLSYLLDHGQVSLALTQSEHDDSIEWPAGIERLCVDRADSLGIDGSPLESVQKPEDLAYVIYTSGSTGVPKGVMIDHRGAVNTILDINERFHVTAKDRVLALSALNFDLSVYDVFGMLAAGGAIVMPDVSADRNPAHWAELVSRHKVTIWNTVPALMQMLVEYQAGYSASLSADLRLVMMSGDWIPVDLPERIKAQSRQIEVVSLGGATEASIWSILYPIESVDPAWPSIPYGWPMVNQTLMVLSDGFAPCPAWVPGQLYIGGIGLAKGYWRDAEKTGASFIVHPETGERLYRTGDLGRYLSGGNIEFLGREDFQVKIRGHRIELGEIDAALAQHPQVRCAVTIAAGEARGNKRLVAYVVPATEPAPSAPGSPSGELMDPFERLQFKLQKPGLRQVNGECSVPLVKPELDDALLKDYLSRRSYRKYADRPVSLEDLSRALSALMPVDIAGAPFPKYRYASAGSLYPVQAYLYVKPGRVAGMEPGTYYYHPGEHRLVEISRGAPIDRNDITGNQAIFDKSAFAVFLVGQMDAIAPVYGDRARDFCMLEAGLICQLLETAGPASQIGFCQVGGLDFSRIRRWFGLGESHLYLHALLAGPLDEGQTGIESYREDCAELRGLVDLAKAARKPEELRHHGPAVRRGVSAEDLHAFVRGKLPEYMAPSTFVFLDALPLSPNGKVDRKALPDPYAGEHHSPEEECDMPSGTSPRNESEQILAGIWQETLGVPAVGIHDNFFELGGDSILAIQIITKANRAGFALAPNHIFEFQTIAELAAGDRGMRTGQDGIPDDLPDDAGTGGADAMDAFEWSQQDLDGIAEAVRKSGDA